MSKLTDDASVLLAEGLALRANGDLSDWGERALDMIQALADDRCLSAVVTDSGLKRCIRGPSHPDSELHVWIESFAVLGRAPLVLAWSGDADANTPEIVGHVETGS